ncbi:MAG: CDP-diacylglycerol--glycerol-3-phosphate 3-phosphatidyltransferase [Spirochaetaceae bacterium]|nr:MAG: CDP-diacylglycerol--glycerol-3-phosphate 3-phosphatidyltransferase [Spirochaetaceae bacterium]
MNIPNTVTSSRIFLSPIFFLVFFVPLWTGFLLQTSIAVLWLLFVYIEFSDALDGDIARRTNQVTDLGKVLDPFADVFSRLTYFVCLLVANLMPVWVFIIILYREFGIIFIRLLMYRKGVALAARSGGKIKTVMYSLGGGAGLLLSSLNRLGMYEPQGRLGLFTPFGVDFPAVYVEIIAYVAFAAYVIAAVLSVLSFLDYVRVFRGHGAA